MDAKVRDTVAHELVGSTITLESAKGEPLAQGTLSGRTETIVATATAKGRAVKVAARNVAGDVLGSVPASEVCDRVDVEPGARVTLTLRLG